MSSSFDGVSFQGPSPAKKHMAALPMAEVRVAQDVGGRWMWAVSFHCSSWGFGYAPMSKWGNFASSRAAALAEGVAELLSKLRETRHAKVPGAVLEWLESLHAATHTATVPAMPAQLSLF